ncbi:MAG: hypothetical protein VX738_00590 [Planctomycetota bacterium]|nr:hypothetical protein [Planctomycetota bacterium]
MDKLSRLKQGVVASSLIAMAFVGLGAGWRMGTHEDVLVMLWEMFPIYFIFMLTRYAKRAIRELENQSSPSGDSDSPDSVPPADEPATDE